MILFPKKQYKAFSVLLCPFVDAILNLMLIYSDLSNDVSLSELAVPTLLRT